MLKNIAILALVIYSVAITAVVAVFLIKPETTKTYNEAISDKISPGKSASITTEVINITTPAVATPTAVTPQVNTPKPTLNLLGEVTTFTNKNYGFTIAQPKSWVVVEKTDSKLVLAKNKACANDNVSFEELMEIYKNCEKFTVWVGDTSEAIFGEDPSYDYNFSGITGKRYIQNYGIQSAVPGNNQVAPIALIEAQVKYNNLNYKFEFKFHQGNINPALVMADNFFQSFKFTK